MGTAMELSGDTEVRNNSIDLSTKESLSAVENEVNGAKQTNNSNSSNKPEEQDSCTEGIKNIGENGRLVTKFRLF